MISRHSRSGGAHAGQRGCKCGSALAHAIITDRKLVPEPRAINWGYWLISTSCNSIAREVLARAVAGRPPKLLPRALVEEACNRALFGVLAEGLADRFDPRLCDVYARLFAQAIEHTEPGREAAASVARYQPAAPWPVAKEPRQVFVLSRVTLGRTWP